VLQGEADGHGLELAKLLIEKGADCDAFGNSSVYACTPLWWAARAVLQGEADGHGLELAKLLIEKGADCDAFGNSSVYACTPL
jgi:hypothetical protein